MEKIERVFITMKPKRERNEGNSEDPNPVNEMEVRKDEIK